MKKIRELKKELGGDYFFLRPLSDKEIRQLQKRNTPQFETRTAVSLTAGCVKIEAVLFKESGRLQLGYDVLVKDTPDANEWICYDSPSDPVSLRESDMLAVLDRVVTQNRLSYTECCFKRIDGKIIKVEKETKE